MAGQKMRYGILGEDHSTTEEKLAKYTGEVAWSYLRDHYQNGVLFFVDPGLKLEEVGLALAEDQASRVAAWLKSGEMVKIEKLHADQWEGRDQLFEALVVSPFVLCRPRS